MNDEVVFFGAFADFKTKGVIADFGVMIKPKDIRVTEDGITIKITDPDICQKIAAMFREEEVEKLEEERKQPRKTRKPSIEGYILCHVNKTPILLPVIEEIEKICVGGKLPDILKIRDIIFGAYEGEISRGTTVSYAYMYRLVLIHRRHIREEGTIPEEKEPKPVHKAVLHNHTLIYNSILLEILRSPNGEKISEIQNIIREKCDESLKSTTVRKYAYDYQEFIKLISVKEVKTIYGKLPDTFDISNVRTHVPLRFGQTEKRANVAKLAVAMLIASFDCVEVSEGAFRKRK